jgi:tRNA threonylcarbamoyladenosine biosynthesis protein TsaE
MRDKYIRTIETRNEEETKAFGKFLGEHAKAGDTFCLTGDLGSGKTVLTKGIAEGLGLSDEVTSPTFALMNIYQGEVPLYHFDVYRLEDPSMIADIGFYDFVGSDGVSVMIGPAMTPKFAFFMYSEIKYPSVPCSIVI